MSQFYTYTYFDPSREEYIYVGKGRKDRANVHVSREDMHPFVQRLQYMKNHDVSPTIQIIHHDSEDQAFELEQFLIEEIGRKDLGTGTLLNLTAGGVGGVGMGPEQRRKLSESRKGRVFTEETRAKLSAAGKRRKLTPEHRAAIARGKTGTAPPVLSEAGRQKIIATMTGRRLSAETKARMSEGMKAKWAARRANNPAYICS